MVDEKCSRGGPSVSTCCTSLRGRPPGSALITAGTNAILSRTLPGFNFLLGSETQPNLVLNALRTVSDVKVLSTPSVVVLDNQVATLQVGDQVPVATASATVLTGTGAPVVNTIDYRNTGVILRVVPRINANGNVLLDIEQEISNVAAGSADNLRATLTKTFLLQEHDAPAALLRGVTRPIPTVARDGTAIYARADLPDDFAYAVAKAIDERQGLLRWSHIPFSYNPSTVWKLGDVPLHPGAARYYKKRGYMK